MSDKDLENLVRRILAADIDSLPVLAASSSVRICRDLYLYVKTMGLQTAAGISGATCYNAARAWIAPLKRRLCSGELLLRDRLEVLLALRDIAEMWICDDVLLGYTDACFDDLFGSIGPDADEDILIRALHLACRMNKYAYDEVYAERSRRLIDSWFERLSHSLSVRGAAERLTVLREFSDCMGDDRYDGQAAALTEICQTGWEFSESSEIPTDEQSETLVACYHCFRSEGGDPILRQQLHAIAQRLFAGMQRDFAIEKSLLPVSNDLWYRIAEVLVNDYCERRMDALEGADRACMA